jgi:glycosyltransferase involved in cell wall biosynthesis
MRPPPRQTDAVRVAVDHTPFHLTRAGTARYVRGLLDALEGAEDVEVQPVAFRRRGRAASLVRDAVWYPAALPFAARRHGAQVLHCTTYRAPLRSSLPVVVTVHDLAVLRHPEAFTPWVRLYGRTALLPVLRAADRVLAVSEFTRREVVELAGVPDDRVRVTPNAVDGRFAPEGAVAEGDYVLAVGTLEPRKRLHVAVEAARRLGVEVRVVGTRGWGGVQAGGDGVRALGFVSDEELARLLRGARCLVYPSRYEGFGLPVLEAMRCGTPVVTSAGTAMEEVAGGAVVLVEGDDPAGFADAIEEADRRRGELRVLGLERARAYSWERTGELTADVYRELA